MKKYKVDDMYCPNECTSGCIKCQPILGIYRNNEFSFVLLRHFDGSKIYGWPYETGIERGWEGKFEKSLSLKSGMKVRWTIATKFEFEVVFKGEENDNIDNVIDQINRELK